MKLVLVTPYFSTHGGGVELVAGRIARELVERYGYEVEWFASGCDPAPMQAPKQLTMRPLGCWNGIERASGIPYPIWGRSAYTELTNAIRSADAVHVHEVAYLSSLLTLGISKKYNVPVLLTQHTGAVRGTGMLLGAANRAFTSIIAKLAFRTSHHVAFVSANSRNYYTPLLPSNDRVSTIFNGVDTGDNDQPVSARTLEEAAEERDAIRASMGLPPVGHASVVVFAGRLVAKKGVGIVKAVASQLPSVEFLVAGRSPKNPIDWGNSQVRELGYVSPSRIREIYRAADLLFLPSYSEGFPLVVQEALVQGCPVLTTEEVATACPEAAKLISTCPVPRSDDPSPWLTALRSGILSAESPDVRAQRAYAARQLWSWTSCTKAYSDLIENRMLRTLHSR